MNDIIKVLHNIEKYFPGALKTMDKTYIIEVTMAKRLINKLLKTNNLIKHGVKYE